MTPNSVMTCADEQDLELTVLTGRLPRDMVGAAYVVGAIPRGTHPLFGGDGRVWRFACEDAAVTLPMRSRTVQTWDQALDAANPGAFTTTGYARSSEEFGFRTLANTAFVRLGDDRLLVTADTGRPWEIDPTTLEVITPVGPYAQWLWSAPHAVNPLVMTTAHPGYDPDSQELFFAELQFVPGDLSTLEGTYNSDLHITRWDGHGDLTRWRVRGAHISMSCHQVCLTANHVIIFDTNFLVEPKQAQDTEYMEAAPGPCQLYIVRRADLVAQNQARGVEAIHVELPVGVVHAACDWEEVGGLITLHIGTPGATDASEWLRASDLTWHEGEPIRDDLLGFLPTSCDTNRIATAVIDPASGELVELHTLSDTSRMWGVGLYARNEALPGPLRAPGSLFWAGNGYDPALLTERLVTLYADHDQRTLPVEDLPTEAVPPRLMRVETGSLEVADEASLPAGRALTSPVFVPRRGASHELDGYILAVVLSDEGDEIWIYDAGDLAAGPVCTLGHDDLSMPWTIHTLWMPVVGPRRARYAVDPERDAALTARVMPAKLAQMMKAFGPS